MVIKDYHGVEIQWTDEEFKRLEDITEGKVNLRKSALTDTDIIYIFTSSDSVKEKALQTDISETYVRNILNAKRLVKRVSEVWQRHHREWLETLSKAQ